MPRLLRRHVVPIALLAASLAAPFFTVGGDSYVTATAGSAVARAAVNEEVAPPETRYAVGGEAMQSAKGLAQQHWGGPACGDKVEIVWTQLEEDTNATASWRNPSDAWNNPGENFDCRIEFNAGADYDWAKFCTVMTHEMGHLSGQPHSDRPGELMSPVYTDALPACEGPEPGAPAQAPAPALDAEPTATQADASADLKRAAKKPAAKKKTTKRKLRRYKAGKRCTRVFKAGRKTFRCKKLKKGARRTATRRLSRDAR